MLKSVGGIVITVDMIVSSKLIVVSFKSATDRKDIEYLLDKLDINYMEFEAENTEFKYRLDVYTE